MPSVLLFHSCTVHQVCLFGQGIHANGTVPYSARIIPFKGQIEFATDINNVMHAHIDRKKKLPVTTLLRAMAASRIKISCRFLTLLVSEGQQEEHEGCYRS